MGHKDENKGKGERGGEGNTPGFLLFTQSSINNFTNQGICCDSILSLVPIFIFLCFVLW